MKWLNFDNTLKIVMPIIGVFILFYCVNWYTRLPHYSYDISELLFFYFSIILFALAGIMFISGPFKKLHFIFIIIGKFINISYYLMKLIFAPIVVYTLVLSVPEIIWGLLTKHYNIQHIENAFFYCAYIMVLIIITYYSKPLFVLFLEKYLKTEYDFTNLYNLFKTEYIRFYVYCILLGTYIVVNIEKFIGYQIIISNQWWIINKNIVLEILLTYIIISSLSDSFTKSKQSNAEGSNN